MEAIGARSCRNLVTQHFQPRPLQRTCPIMRAPIDMGFCFAFSLSGFATVWLCQVYPICVCLSRSSKHGSGAVVIRRPPRHFLGVALISESALGITYQHYHANIEHPTRGSFCICSLHTSSLDSKSSKESDASPTTRKSRRSRKASPNNVQSHKCPFSASFACQALSASRFAMAFS